MKKINATEYILKKFNVDTTKEPPYYLPISRFSGFLEILRDLGVETGAEIGVSTGFYSKWLWLKVKPKKLYLVDPYMAYDDYVESSMGHDGRPWILGEHYEKAKKRLERFENKEFVIKTSMEAVKDFKDNSLDFVFIDGNHTFEYVIDDIAAWSKKVKPGGIISGHDYWMSYDKEHYRNTLPKKDAIKIVQVKDAVDAWTKANRIETWFVTEQHPTWFWVKEE